MYFLQENLIYIIPVLGIIGILVMLTKSAWVSKQDAGAENMKTLAGYIADGAMAFLRAEWKILSYFVVIAALLLAYSGTLVKTSSWVKTPPAIRKHGGAIFCDRRYEHVFMYHNGADSYYAARGFRCSLRV